MGVEGKLNKYDKKLNSFKILDNEKDTANFIKYSVQDSVALLNALTKAQKIYLDKYKVDIASI